MKVARVLFAASLLLVAVPGSAILRGMSDKERFLPRKKDGDENKTGMEMRTKARDAPAPTPLPTSPPTPVPTLPPTPLPKTSPTDLIPVLPGDTGAARAPWSQCEDDTICDVNNIADCTQCNCTVPCEMSVSPPCVGYCAHDDTQSCDDTENTCVGNKLCNSESKCENGEACTNPGESDVACGKSDCVIGSCQ